MFDIPLLALLLALSVLRLPWINAAKAMNLLLRPHAFKAYPAFAHRVSSSSAPIPTYM